MRKNTAAEPFNIPDQGTSQYVYKRQQPVMAAAFPQWAKHFESGCLYVPCDPTVGFSYHPWWHPMNLGIKQFTTGFPPPAIKFFEFEGQANTDIPNPRCRVAVRNGTINLGSIRKKVEEVRQKAAAQICSYLNQEKQITDYAVALTLGEMEFLRGTPRCRCGHLQAFHFDSLDSYESTLYCAIPGCHCKPN